MFLPGKLRTPLSAASYESKMDWEFRERRAGQRVDCTICHANLAVGSLRSHLVTQHDVHQNFVPPDVEPVDPRTWVYTASWYPADGKAGLFRCPVLDCPQGDEDYGCATSFNLRWHFAFRHPQHEVEINGEVLPRCGACKMQTGRAAIGTAKHLASKHCREMAARRRRHRVAADGARAMRRTFTAYGKELRRVDRFKYLGRVLSYDDSDTPAIRRNLKRARVAWGRLSTVIAKESVPPPVAGMFYQAVVAAVLLYGSESWVLSAYDLRALEGFHVECARRLTGMRPSKRGEIWVYPKSSDVLRAARLQSIRAYIAKRRQTVLRAVADRPILEECRGAERRRGIPVRLSWWEQEFEEEVELQGVDEEEEVRWLSD